MIVMGESLFKIGIFLIYFKEAYLVKVKFMPIIFHSKNCLSSLYQIIIKSYTVFC